MKSRLREPFNGLTHIVGAFLCVLMALRAPVVFVDLKATTVTLFAGAGVFLFVSSALYHVYIGPASRIAILRTLDHAMIYTFIAASYTPYCLLHLADKRGGWVTGIVWGLAVAGVGVRLTNPPSGRIIRVVLYSLMAWMSLVIMPDLFPTLNFASRLGLILGAVFYSLGALVYASRKPDLFPNTVGFHGLWHLAVIGGVLSHAYSIWNL